VKFRKFFYWLRGSAGVHFRLNKKLYIFLALSVILGVAAGFAVMFNARMTVDRISRTLLDANLQRALMPMAGVGGFLMGRIFDFILALALVFLLSLHRWTVLLVFPFVALKSYTLVVNLYWIVARFGFMAGGVLFFIYLFWLIVIMIVFITAVVFLLRSCAGVRQGGFRGALQTKRFLKSMGIFVGVILAIGFLEWVLYALVLSKFVFM
jgi:hypothetical protein